MLNIGLIPLDSRPCNCVWLEEFAKIAKVNLVSYPREKCGTLPVGASLDEMINWTYANASKLDYLIISTDGLTFGGLVQARKADINLEETKQKLSFIADIKIKYPHLKIYCFDTMMRNAITAYDSESAKYYMYMCEYATLKGKVYFFNKEEDISRLHELENIIPHHIIDTYLYARNVKLEINCFYIDLYKKGIIDKYILLQEDSSPNGIQAIDQEKLTAYLAKLGLKDKFEFYNGTDEGASVMFASILVNEYNLHYKINVLTKNNDVLNSVHLFEDRPFKVNLAKMACAIGLDFTTDINQADCVLAVFGEEESHDLNLSKYEQIKPVKDFAYRTFVKNVNSLVKEKNVFLVDLLFPNGGSPDLLEDIDYLSLKGYSAWNTSSNSLGSALCELVCYMLSKNETDNNRFLKERIIDDCIYQYIVRRQVTEKLIEQNISIFKLEDKTEYARKLVEEGLNKYTNLIGNAKLKVSLPWNRMFEVEALIKE